MNASQPKQWYVKELSRLTKVSVRTLHHYDRISLLRPSVRLANGYRLYSESDLLKLQQILALKFFGFELSVIKIMMADRINQLDHFKAQKQTLEQKIRGFKDATEVLDKAITDCEVDKSIPWESVIQLIGVYRMTQELEKSWAAKVYSPEQLKQFAALKTRYSEQEMADYQQKWKELIEETGQQLDKDPKSMLGREFAKRWMELTNSVYGGADINLRNRIWDAYKNKEIPDSPIPHDVVLWIDQAMYARVREQVYGLLSQVDTRPSEELAKDWEGLMNDMYGADQTSKDELYAVALKDEHVSEAARKWLRQTLGVKD